MGNIRVHELAKELKKSNREVSDRLRKLEIPAKSNLSSISPEDANRVRKSFGVKPKKIEKPAKKAKKAKTAKKKPAGKPTKKPAKKPKAPAGKAKKKTAGKPAGKPTKKPAKKHKAPAGKARKPAVKHKAPAGKAKKKTAGKPKAPAGKTAATEAREAPKDEAGVPVTQAKKEKVAPPEAREEKKPVAKPSIAQPEKKTAQPQRVAKKKEAATKKAGRPTLRVAPPDKKSSAPPKKKGVYRYVPKGKGRRGSRVKGPPSTVARKQFRVPPGITVKDFAQMAGLKPADVIQRLMGFGEMLTINQSISDDALRLLSEDLGVEIKIKAARFEELEEIDQIIDHEEDLESKSPVVTILGHVDHGKTLLLDTIRKTDVISQETGGITQHIGAYQVNFRGKPITFVDTPGHESFTAMRARGAQITDIAVLVVAADDGVMPQTVEAIDHAREADVPIIVAVNKIDKHEADPHKVRQQLSEQGLIPDDWGGETVFVDISAKEGTNIDHLLEMIQLLSEMQEIKVNPNAKAAGIVVEAQLEKTRGSVATILINRGTARVGDAMVVGDAWGRIRALFDDHGESIESAGPSKPVEVLGLSKLPMAGDEFRVVEDEKRARQVADRRRMQRRLEEQAVPQPVSLENLFDRIKEGEIKELKVVLKADTQGSLEAIMDSLDKIDQDEVKIKVIHSGVGGVAETDIMLASASDAIVLGFHVRPDSKAAKAADLENIDIRTYGVIYDLTEEVESALLGMLEPEYEEEVQGRLEVRQTFRVPGIGAIAGCYVLEGEIFRNSQVRVVRDGVVIHDGRVSSLRRFKDDVKSVASGFECGVAIEGFQDLKERDILEAYQMIEIPR